MTDSKLPSFTFDLHVLGVMTEPMTPEHESDLRKRCSSDMQAALATVDVLRAEIERLRCDDSQCPARLIAAAPELLAAAEHLLAPLDADGFLLARDALAEAVAKARGES